jgi:hypothetical protein
MRCQILHVNGDDKQKVAAIVKAIDDFAALSAVHENCFTAHYAGPIHIASTRALKMSKVKFASNGARIHFVSGYTRHHIFVDCEEPKVTVAGWYDGPFAIGEYFPHCKFKVMQGWEFTPLLREAQFYISVLRNNNVNLNAIGTRLAQLEPKESCGHVAGPIRFVWAESRKEECAKCLRSNHKDTLCVFGKYTDTEYTRTGEGLHGENNEYIVIGGFEQDGSQRNEYCVIRDALRGCLAGKIAVVPYSKYGF